MKTIRSVWIMTLACCAVASSSLAAGTPQVGRKAPVFEAKDQNGKDWTLADRVGKKVVLLYFYPKDDTPGCTKEACGLRDRMESLNKANVEVVGVSFDDAQSHQKFIAKHNLKFTLLVDTDGAISQIYGAKMEGKNMARRVSFLISLDGTIAHVTDSPDASVHLAEMKEAVEKLKK